MLGGSPLYSFILIFSMLGFTSGVCSVHGGVFGSANLEVPIWMDNVQCLGIEEALDQCVFSGWGENSCDHNDDAGVICMDGKLILCCTMCSLSYTVVQAQRKNNVYCSAEQ